MAGVSRHYVSSVLGCPARRTGEGGGHHDGGGLGHAAHGTGNIVVNMARDVFVLCTVQRGRAMCGCCIIKLWCQGQTECVDGSSCAGIDRTSYHT